MIFSRTGMWVTGHDGREYLYRSTVCPIPGGKSSAGTRIARAQILPLVLLASERGGPNETVAAMPVRHSVGADGV